MPFGFSSSGDFSGSLVFAGYGLRAEPLDYDDYAGVDVRGKVVLAMRYEPGEADEGSPFDGRRPTRWSDLRYKAHVAREAGAAALVFVDPPNDQEDRLPVLKQEGPISRAGLPVLQVSRDVAREWLAAGGHELERLRAEIDESYRPRSVEIPSLEVAGRVDVVTTEATVSNVLGVLPGAGDLGREVVVVGAHYDHLGIREHGSLPAGAEAIHNGADDNASGVAAMVCGVGGLAARLETGSGARRTLVVGAFGAEEIGLGGSAWYVQHPPFPIEDTVAMVNLDMVGRLRDARLSVIGTDSALEWDDLLPGVAVGHDLEFTTGGDGYGPSDQTSFYEKGIPVVHLFTGAHAEYHNPNDDVGTLNVDGGGQVAAFLEDLLAHLLAREERLTYRESATGPMMTGDSRGYGSYLGTIPDYTKMGAAEGGVLLLDVRKGGPAEAAGLRGGDLIARMAGVDVENLYDMVYVLRDHRPGETIEIEFVRGEERSSVRATLGQRHRDEERGPSPPVWSPSAGREASHLLHADETHLADLRQLTFGGENAEGYFAPDGRSLVFQRTPPEGGCDQMYLLDLDSGDVTRLSSGRGRTTCGYYAYPDGERLIYSTTEGASVDCPPPPDHSRGYVWALYDYDMVWQSGPGAEPEPFLPDPAYDAEATVCVQDGRVVFTSTRSGDLDLWIVDADGSNLRRLTETPGYDGGAFFSADCSAIVWRASRPTGAALEDYRSLLAQRLVRPSALEIFWMDLASEEVRQLTRNGRANFGPYPLPDDSGAIFSSNLGGSEREFDLYRVGLDGGEPERITYTAGFDGFPVFSPDGRWLVFASNRAAEGGETNLFIARWVD
jgi:Tol biopolymer transport system component